MEEYESNNGHYPICHDLNELKSLLDPKDQRFLHNNWNDGWNRPLHYESVADGKGYYVYSLGRDGKMDVAKAADYSVCDIKYYESDIVLSDGQFIRSPGHTHGFRGFNAQTDNCNPPNK